MSLAASPMRPFQEGRRRADCDDLFDEFIDSDSFDLSDNGTSDRANADDWNLLFEFPSPFQNPFCQIGPSKSSAVDDSFPSPVAGKTPIVPSDVGWIASSVELDSIKSPAHPHASKFLSNGKTSRTVPSNTIAATGSKVEGVRKNLVGLNSLSKMSNRGTRRPSGDKRDSRRGSTSGSSTASGKATKRVVTTTATTMSQPQWSPSSTAPPTFYQASSSGLHQQEMSPYEESMQARDPLHLSRTTSAQLSPLISPGYGDIRQEDMTNYFQSPTTPYATEAEAHLHQGFSSYTGEHPETSFPFGAQHEASVPMAYTRDQEYPESHAQHWWTAASGAQPYNANYSAAGYQRSHVSHFTDNQSACHANISVLPIKREADVPESNYRSFGYEQQQPRRLYLEPIQGASMAGPQSGQTHHHLPMRSSPIFDIPGRRSSSPLEKISTSASQASQSVIVPSSSPLKPRKTSKTPSAGTPGREDRPSIDFVNLTAEDGPKILTGVAPSGSSKTKARREKEALERRRHLSRAAAKAVLEAGGDLEALQREGFVIESEDEDEEEESYSRS